MLDQLLEQFKGGALEDIMLKFGLDKEKADGVFKAAGDSTSEVMQEKVSGGMLDTVMNLFSSNDNGDSENGILASVKDNFIGKITSQLGIDSSAAGGIADSILPKLTGMITNKNEETPGTDTSSIMSMFGGNALDGIKDTVTSKLKNLF